MQYKIKREMAETGRNWNGSAKIMKNYCIKNGKYSSKTNDVLM